MTDLDRQWPGLAALTLALHQSGKRRADSLDAVAQRMADTIRGAGISADDITNALQATRQGTAEQQWRVASMATAAPLPIRPPFEDVPMTIETRTSPTRSARELAGYHGTMLQREAIGDALAVLQDETRPKADRITDVLDLLGTAYALAEPCVEIAGTR